MILLFVGILIVTGIDKKIETALIERFDVTSLEQGILDRIIPVAPEHTLSTTAPVKVEPSGSTAANILIPPVPLSVEHPAPAPEFPASLTEWINSHPLTMASLKGKVVLIDFWTYSCINCQRTLPYLTAWDRKYRDQGLVIIGVHAPEFAFEKIRSNVEQAVKTAGIEYPVVLDNDFTLWNAYNNRYWPAKYFIDRA